jgi:glycosyltransferase involved in cell wall biosynthesis
MAVRDGAAYVAEAIESVLAQTFPDFELIVVDDGSRDGTPQILAAYPRRDDRVRVLAHQGGVCGARNLAAREARGRYLACLDADDLALPERLELQVGLLEENRGVVVVGGTGIFIDERGAAFGQASYPENPRDAAALLESGRAPVIQSAATIRTDAFRETSGFRAVLRVAHDYDLWLQLAARGEITNVGDPVVHYRFHAAQISGRDLERTAAEVLAALASARARERGDPDPLEDVEEIDSAFLARLGIAPEDVAAQALDDMLWLARTLEAGGLRQRALPLWRGAMQQARMTADPRRARARTLRARAESGPADGHRIRALLLRARAGALEPRETAGRLRRLVAGN